MWYIKSDRDGSMLHLLMGKTYRVNRKDGDLVLLNDQSISRNHGALHVSEEGEVFLWDEGSKYGTYIYKGTVEKKLEPQVRVKIKIDDKLRFGLQWNIFVLCKINIMVSSSSITAEEKKLLKSLMPKIGGKYSNDWNDHCTHLVMNQVSLTHKVVLALAAGKPITTLLYWQKMEDAISNQTALPKVDDYQPPIGEEELQKQTKPGTLLPNENRKSLFSGKVFVFSSEEIKIKRKPLVECAGGVCKSVESTQLLPAVCCEPNYVVVKESDACLQIMRDIIAALKRKGLRTIPISEIGLAIYNESLIRYCNPSWRKPVLLGGSPSQSQGVCLVENTEDILVNTQNIKTETREDIVIPPSLGSVVSDTSIDNSRSAKRPSSSVDDRPSKRQAQVNETEKREGSIRQWLRGSTDKQASSSKDSQATCSFDTSRDDLFGSTAPKKPNGNSFKSDISGNSNRSDNDQFKVPSPKKSGVKRGRTEEEEGFKVPSPKKALSRRTASEGTFKTMVDYDVKLQLSKSKGGVQRVEEDDDEFKVPSPPSKKSSRLSLSRIEDDLEKDEFEIPSSSRKKSNRRIDDEDDTVSNETVRGATKKSKTVLEGRASSSVISGDTSKSGPSNQSKEKRVVSRTETSNTSSANSNVSRISPGRKYTPSISEFFDRSVVGAAFKKEECDDKDSDEKELASIFSNVNIIEMSLYRERPPLRQMSSNSVIDGRPNFKKFRKSTAQIERSRIELVVDANANASIYVGVPEPDPDAPLETSSSRNDLTETAEELFPSTIDRNQRSRQNRPNRPQGNRIVDEWTVP